MTSKGTMTKGDQTLSSITTYQYSVTGQVTEENTVTEKISGTGQPQVKESKKIYTHGIYGNVEKIIEGGKKVWRGDATETAYQYRETRSIYDRKGRNTQNYDPKGTVGDYSDYQVYDAQNRLVEQRTPRENKKGQITYATTQYIYDTDQQLIEQQEELEEGVFARTEYGYDKFGNVVMVKEHLIDKTGNSTGTQVTQYLYDFEGNKIREFTGMSTPMDISLSIGAGLDNYSYCGHTYSVNVDANGQAYRVTKYAYSFKNKLISITDPMGKTETYKYDGQGNLIEIVDKDGNSSNHQYDAQNRLTKTSAIDKETGRTTTHAYAYEREEGHLEKADNIQYLYEDISGGMTKEIIMGTKEIVKETTYDVTGRRDNFTVQIGDQIHMMQSFEYDSFNRLETVWDGTSEAVRYTYDINGNLETCKNKASVTTYAYNLGNQITELTTPTAAFKTEYRKNGQKVEESSSVDDKTRTYIYDSLGRLTKENGIEYYYDSNNNRTKMINGKTTTRYKYNKNDELLREDNGCITAYHYDNRGNQVGVVMEQTEQMPKKGAPNVTMSMTLGENRLNHNVVNHYNALNQLETTLTQNYKIRYEYNADGLRSKKSVNTSRRGYVDTHYIWDGDQLVFELDEEYNVSKRYIRGLSLVCADAGEGTEKTYFVMDGHGSVVQLLDNAGTVVKTYSYDAFGNEYSEETTDNNPFRYAGEYYDWETENYYLRARYFDPAIGRFITSDDIETYGDLNDPLSLNRYTYCRNDPVNYLDPSGHKYIKEQSDYELINKKYMKDIPVGEWGNVSDNGCGSIAVYNVLTSKGYTGNFFYVNTNLQRSGYDYIGVGGLNPLSVTSFMEERFTTVKIAVANKYRWMSIAKESEAVITLFAWPGFSGAHYVAGIKAKKGTGWKFRFYNTFDKINGKKITMKRYIKILKNEGCKRLYLVGVKDKKNW